MFTTLLVRSPSAPRYLFNLFLHFQACLVFLIRISATRLHAPAHPISPPPVPCSLTLPQHRTRVTPAQRANNEATKTRGHLVVYDITISSSNAPLPVSKSQLTPESSFTIFLPPLRHISAFVSCLLAKQQEIRRQTQSGPRPAATGFATCGTLAFPPSSHRLSHVADTARVSAFFSTHVFNTISHRSTYLAVSTHRSIF